MTNGSEYISSTHLTCSAAFQNHGHLIIPYSVMNFDCSVIHPRYSAFNVECFVCMIHTPDHKSRPDQFILCTVTATMCAYCHASFHLLHQASSSNCKSMLEQHRQMERERMAAKTQNKGATTLHRLGIAVSLMLIPQCFGKCCDSAYSKQMTYTHCSCALLSHTIEPKSMM